MGIFVDWDNKEEALQRLRELYPNMKEFLIEITYDLYKQSLTDEDLQKKIDEVEEEAHDGLPTIHDYPEKDYKTEGTVSVLKKGEYPEWECEYCGRSDETFRSEDTPQFCKGCFEYFTKKKEEGEETPEIKSI